MKTKPHHGFSMTEMLVVVGILVLLTGLLLPALLKSRQQARVAVCQSNLRQLGTLYVLYAERNEDYIPLGTSRWKDPNLLGVGYTPGNPSTKLTYHWPAYHIHNNHYVWISGAPSAAMGPFFLAGLITPDNAKILSCPSEMNKWARVEFQYKNASDAHNGNTDAIVYTSYGVRPIQRVWTHDNLRHTVEYPSLMPKLSRNDHFALLAEDLQPFPPTIADSDPLGTVGDTTSHGTASGKFINALYGDGSVRMYKLSADDMRAHTYSGGFNEAETYPAINEDDPTVPPAWKQLDAN